VTADGVSVDVGACTLDVSLWADDVVRVRYAVAGTRPPRRSWAVASPPPRRVPVTIGTTARGTDVVGDRVEVHVDGDGRVTIGDRADGRIVVADPQHGGPAVVDERVVWTHAMPAGTRAYGFGERTGLLDKRGYRYTCWTTDRFEDHGPRTDEMYVSVPFVFGLDDAGRAWGVFVDTTYRTAFDLSDVLGGTWCVEVDTSWMDWYCILGPD